MNKINHPPTIIISEASSPSLHPQSSSVEHNKIPVKQLSNPALMVKVAHVTGNSPEQYNRADDDTLLKVAVTAERRLAKSTDYPLPSSKIPVKMLETEVWPVKNKHLLSPLMIRSENSNHLVKRDDWVSYGNPDVFNTEFRLFVDRFKDRIIQKNITAKDLIEEAIITRKNIEITRNNIEADDFGLLRNNLHNFCLNTPLNTTYSCGKQRAVALTHNKFFINHRTKEGENFVNHIASEYGLYPCEIDNIHSGVVVGHAGNNKIYLTQIFTSPRINNSGMSYYFGRYDEYYVGSDKRSALIIHTDPDQLSPGLQHIQGLIDQAMAGDLSVIPRIHWWYVHLAPTVRGPGGTVEMIIHALCAANGYYLPGWATGIAPSIEVLVEPNEEAFCRNYPTLFEAHQGALRMLFTKRSA
ncbi:hypothetical protein ACTL6P_14695 [Endozoicomonas acroporae]|uniref:hypothetical protein n=1 Tax=Endozoicomonas acroporae TaxID=1701104 RepID=UPI0011AF6B9F|nr:hypothetical protein [Endozoicomonas acroporae]